MKLWMAVGLLAAGMPLAHADVGVVSRVDGERITVHVGFVSLRLGERVGLSVIPERGFGGGSGVVSDIDVENHNVGIVLNSSSGFKIFERDSLYITMPGDFTTPPDFRIERPAPPVLPLRRDILMPVGTSLALPSLSAPPSETTRPGVPSLQDVIGPAPGINPPADQPAPDEPNVIPISSKPAAPKTVIQITQLEPDKQKDISGK